MFKAFYSGKQSSLTLFRHVPRKLKNLGPQSTTLPSLYGIPESTAVETDYVFEKHPSPNKKSPSKLHGFPQYSQSPISDLSFQTASLLRLDSFRDLKPIMINDLPELPLVDSPSFPAIFDDKDEHFCFGHTSENDCDNVTTRTFDIPISTAKSTKITMTKPDSRNSYCFQPSNIDFYVISESKLDCTFNDLKNMKLSLLLFCFCISS